MGSIPGLSYGLGFPQPIRLNLEAATSSPCGEVRPSASMLQILMMEETLSILEPYEALHNHLLP